MPPTPTPMQPLSMGGCTEGGPAEPGAEEAVTEAEGAAVAAEDAVDGGGGGGGRRTCSSNVMTLLRKLS